MNWRFTAIDFTMDPNGTRTVLTENNGTTLYEPTGWTDASIDVNRDEDLKGVFFDYSFSSLKWTGIMYAILKAAYNGFGIAANVQLLIEYFCPDCDDCQYQFFYQAQFNFTEYKEVLADFCYIDVPLETSSALLQFNNLYDQKVDLENLIAYDLKTPLNQYDGMGKVITLKNKTVIERIVADNTSVGIGDAQFGPQPISYPLYNDQFFTPTIPTLEVGYFIPPYTNVRAVEILQSFVQYPNIGVNTNTGLTSVQIAYSGANDPAHIGGAYFIYKPRLLPINIANLVQVGPPSIHIKFKGSYSDVGPTGLGVFQILFISYLFDSNGNRTVNQVIQSSPLFRATGPTDIINFDFEYNNDAYPLQNGEALMLVVTFGLFGRDSRPNFTFDGSNFINCEATTTYIDTACKVFFVNEVMSRIAENITNGALPVVSDYFGRTDSQPYAAAADGDGGMEVLTKGLIMRGLQARLAVLNAQGGYLDNFNSSQSDILNNVNIFSLSFSDVFGGLDAVHCIGAGPEDDPTRMGKQRLRVERFDYFFQHNILMTLDHVFEIDKQSKSGKYFSLMNFGYSKWETKSYDGLDEFATKRQYRSTFTQIQNTLDKTCDFVASGYAIEYCRRLSGDATSDSEFDNDTFLICVLPMKLALQQIQFKAGNIIYITDQVLIFPVGATFSITQGASTVTYTVLACTQNIVQTSPTELFGGDSIITVKETLVPGAIFAGMVQSVSPRLFEAEQGNVTTTSGEIDQTTCFVVDPSTLYNWRISPFRNMMRWMKYLLAQYRNPYDPSSVFVFVDGDGNYFATGQQLDPEGKYEAVDVKESQPLSIQIFADQPSNEPIFYLEEDSFSYPMSAQDFVAVKANPYGLIQYYRDPSDLRFGWISKISYSPVSGTAKFTIIPKRA